jgi:hypothetical protein
MQKSTVGTQLPGDQADASAPAIAAGAPAPRARASGRVTLGRDARLWLTSVKLGDIRGPHPALRDRDTRLDLASSTMIDLARWTPDSLDIFLCAAPLWVIERGQSADRHFLVVAGAQLLPALRMALPPSAQVPVVQLEAKLTTRRWLQVAAMHTAAISSLAAGQSQAYLQAVLSDAEAAGGQLVMDPEPEARTAPTSQWLASRRR